MGAQPEAAGTVSSLLPSEEEGFSGTYSRLLDEKARVVLHGPWREAFADGAKLSNWNGRLALWSRRGFRDVLAETRSQERIGAMPKGAYRGLLAGSYDVTPDATGRVLLPADLRRGVGIGDKGSATVLVGVNNRVEIWDAGRHEAATRDDDPNAAAKALDDFLY